MSDASHFPGTHHPIPGLQDFRIRPTLNLRSTHRKTRDPVRSSIDKPLNARLVVGSVTTSESLVLYVFLVFSLLFLHHLHQTSPISAEVFPVRHGQTQCSDFASSPHRRATLFPGESALSYAEMLSRAVIHGARLPTVEAVGRGTVKRPCGRNGERGDIST